MDDTQVKHVLEAALLAAGRPIPLDKLVQLFATKGPDVDRDVVRHGLESLSADYEGRGLQVKEVASGFRIQIKSSMSPWLQPLWEERQPRYSRALLETLALIAYRQPITRGEIEDVRGVTVNPNIIKTMLERNWVRVVGHRDVPGKPEMFGTTREFLDYFGLRSIDELPALAEINENSPIDNPQVDLLDDFATTEQLSPDEADEPGENAVNAAANAAVDDSVAASTDECADANDNAGETDAGSMDRIAVEGQEQEGGDEEDEPIVVQVAVDAVSETIESEPQEEDAEPIRASESH